MAQLITAGTASLRFIPGGGAHTYIAVFAGTNNYAASVSSPRSVKALHATTSSIASSGSVGNYTLTGTAVGTGNFSLGPNGNVSFVDTTIGNYVLGMAPLGPAIFGQSFVTSPVIPVGANPVSAVGDFNGDGIADLAVVDSNNNNVSILRGDGSGGFSAASGSPISVGAGPVSIAVGDFNGDGVTDLAVVKALPIGVSTLQASFPGDANFLASVSSPLSFTVSKSTPGIGGVAPVTMASSLNSSTYSQSVTFTATVPNGATGTVLSPNSIGDLATNDQPVTFNNGGTLLGSGIVAGTSTTALTASVSSA